MDLLQLFRQYIKDEKLFNHTEPLLVAVSGGVDSMVLCELCKRAGFNFIIAHCNFQLRGEESNKDEEFVRQWGATAGIPVLVKTFDTQTYATKYKLSVQVAARQLRYEWFNSIIKNENAPGYQTRNVDVKAGAATNAELPPLPGQGQALPLHSTSTPELRTLNSKLILTAHHADDNIETVLMNFFKGTGIAGLRGILPRQGNTVRPLLFARKAAIEDFAIQHNIQYREDASNASDKYTRNYFRNQLLPAVQKIYPQAMENMAKNLLRFRETEEIYRQAIGLHKKKLLEYKENEVHIPVLKLKKAIALHTILYEIIIEFGFTAHQVDEVAELLDSETGKYVQSATYRIIKSRNWLILSPHKIADTQTIVINNEDTVVPFSQGSLTFRQHSINNFQPTASACIAQLDAAKIKFPLLLRPRRQGDYFYPLGMQKKKKVGRFLTDQKISQTEKESIRILEMDKTVLWVIGKRIDDRFKITDHTKNMLCITFTPTGSE